MVLPAVSQHAAVAVAPGVPGNSCCKPKGHPVIPVEFCQMSSVHEGTRICPEKYLCLGWQHFNMHMLITLSHRTGIQQHCLILVFSIPDFGVSFSSQEKLSLMHTIKTVADGLP